MEAIMRRGVTVVTLSLLMCALSSSPATAGSAWDPDDVSGPLDVRWVGAGFASPHELNIIVSFYDDFRVGALTTIHSGQKGVVVNLQEFATGFFVRRPGGRIIFVWGDLGSSCGGWNFPWHCERGVVTRISANVLRVTIVPEFDNSPWNIGVETFWRLPNGAGSEERDRTTRLALGFPPEAA
jgi:hypothetical protein